MSDHKLQSQGLVTTLIGKLFWPLSGNYHLIGTADTIQSIFLKVMMTEIQGLQLLLLHVTQFAPMSLLALPLACEQAS